MLLMFVIDAVSIVVNGTILESQLEPGRVGCQRYSLVKTGYAVGER
jgi:hypothetical protein